MSTTNPPSGNPQPGAGRQWPADALHGSAPDDSGGGGGINPDSIRAGHEPDAFAVLPILSVPLAVVIAFVIAFSVAAGMFAYYMPSETPPPFSHPDAVAEGKESLPVRLQRIERAGYGSDPYRQVDQPRLEPLTVRAIGSDHFVQPLLPMGNSPEIHWEDIRPDRVPGLQTAGYNGPDRKLAHIPIAEAMRIAVETKGMFPVQKAASKPVSTAVHPSAANGGRGVSPPAPKIVAQGDETKTPPKKADDKKETPSKSPAPAPTEKK